MLRLMGDSQLVINQITKEYKCPSVNMAKYLTILARLYYEFNDVIVKHMLRLKKRKGQ